MARHHFPGYPAFLDAAAQQIGCPEAARAARGIESLAALANLCAQATEADGGHVEGILAKASEFRDQLHAAYRAAELMIADVRAARVPARVRPGPEPGRRNKSANPAS